MFSSSASWNKAAIAGFVMAAATIALDLLKNWSAMAGGFLGVFLNMLLSVAKVFACFLLFRYLMRRFFNEYEDLTYQRLQHYGLKLALFSSLLCAAFSLYQAINLDPEEIRAAMEASAGQLSSMIDSNTEAALESVFPKLPAITFFTMFGYCFLWGWSLSTVFARDLFRDRDPFDEAFDGDNQSIDNQ